LVVRPNRVAATRTCFVFRQIRRGEPQSTLQQTTNDRVDRAPPTIDQVEATEMPGRSSNFLNDGLKQPDNEDDGVVSHQTHRQTTNSVRLKIATRVAGTTMQ
jgi:hypothetical protein